MRGRLLLVCSLLLSGWHAAQATDQLVLGTELLLKNSSATKRTVKITARDRGGDDTLVGNPITGGATLTVSANGSNSTSETYTLPAGVSVMNRPFWSGDAVKGFKYKDNQGENGPVRSAQIKAKYGVFQIKIKIDGSLAPVAVVPPNPGVSGCALLIINNGDTYSVKFGSGQVSNNGATLFKVAHPISQGSCIASTTSTTTTTTTSTTTTTLGLPFQVPPGAAPLRYRDQIFSSVSTTSDIVYGSAVNNSNQTVTLKLDLYQPVGDTVTLRPLIIWVHGGSFSSGDKTSAELVDEANYFAKKGYVNVSINYRLEPGGCSAAIPTATCVIAIQEAFLDAQAAVRFMRTNAAAYGVDPTRIAIGGSSAGAITACNVGYTSTEDPTAAVGGVLSLSGGRLIGTVDATDAPSLLFHTTGDPIVPYQWSVNTYNAATAAGADSFLTTWSGNIHVPYVQHRTEILDQSTNFLYWELDLTNAAQ